MDKFKKAFKNGANIGYLVAGYPSLEYTKEFLKEKYKWVRVIK